MIRKKLPIIKECYRLYFEVGLSQNKISDSLKIARSTVGNYIHKIDDLPLGWNEIKELSSILLEQQLFGFPPPTFSPEIEALFRNVYELVDNEQSTIKDVWSSYCIDQKKKGLPIHSRSTFYHDFKYWRETNNLSNRFIRKWKVTDISEKDKLQLEKWHRSGDKRKWEKAVAILGAANGTPISDLEKKLERSSRKIIRWIRAFREKGIIGLSIGNKRVLPAIIDRMQLKKDNLLRLIHQPPSVFNINRTSWCLNDLSVVYEKEYGAPFSRSSVSKYINQAGYSFKKAKKVLTSTDPLYREKLQELTHILSSLTTEEAFFSVDEFGPFSVKIQGGRSLTPNGTLRTFPQWQVSKGRLIVTAALELSSNQITHFYSEKKNTAEMIKLMHLLIETHTNKQRIFLSWDAASWHISKALAKEVAIVNSIEFRTLHKTPLVQLAPLPSSAQFLNVIESVFSGLARAIIHNSNYTGVKECKVAIDRYFMERNAHFLVNPKRAGDKIWGKEAIAPVFNAANNCKDPKWR